MFPNIYAVRSDHIVLQITDIGCRGHLTDVLIRIIVKYNRLDWTAVKLNRI
jgi:hypothetical protein